MSQQSMYESIIRYDPSFNLYVFYDRLYEWHQHYRTMQNDMLYKSYRSFSGTDWLVRHHMDSISIETPLYESLYKELLSIGYNDAIVSMSSSSIIIKDGYHLSQSFAHMNSIECMHPISAYRYYGYNNGIGITYKCVPIVTNYPYRYHPCREYDPDILLSIQEIDPTITLDAIYNMCIDRYNRYRISKQYNDIDLLSIDDSNTLMIKKLDGSLLYYNNARSLYNSIVYYDMSIHHWVPNIQYDTSYLYGNIKIL